ncbi:methyltransferase family protein [Microbacterium sp. 22242]|uniref:methyltransferase family protein n=1 Tax=Microbacterium sp. 22242 TaxID=3453896 RepID=UPI003F84A80B
MARASATAYAVVAYLCFLAVLVRAIAFLADIGPAVIDGAPVTAWPVAAAVDLLLVAVFALHHSVFARAAVKRRLERMLPMRVERATYVLTASALLALVLWQWRPIPAIVWDVRAEPWRTMLWAGCALGWLVAIGASFMIDHLGFVGLRQAAMGRPADHAFQARWLYAVVRHPLMLGLLLAFWITPVMTWGHVLFAAAFSAYIAVGIRFEERDLRAELGEPYRRYAQRTAALVPGVRMPARRSRPPRLRRG